MFFIVLNRNSSLEETNLFLVGHFTRFINCRSSEEIEPRLLESTGLTSVNWNTQKYFVVEEIWVVFKLVVVESSVM